MSSAPALARTVDALQLLVAQLSERVSFLEDCVAALERAESSWDAVSEARPSSVPGAFDSTQPSASASPAARAFAQPSVSAPAQPSASAPRGAFHRSQAGATARDSQRAGNARAPSSGEVDPTDTVGRRALAQELGAFVRRALAGEHLQPSGRARLNLRSRIYLAFADFEGRFCSRPRSFAIILRLLLCASAAPPWGVLSSLGSLVCGKPKNCWSVLGSSG